MILYFLRYLRGYLEVRFEGVSSETILSKLANEKIPIWNLKYSGGCIDGRMFAKDFMRMRSIRKNTGVRIAITKKNGFPFFWRKYNRRTGFLFGTVIFFALLKFLSTFLWIINIEGNSNTKSGDIIASLSDIGIIETMKITDIDAKLSAQRLLLNRNDLSWASLNIEGCVLNVNVREIEKKPINDDAFPTNIVASRDGIITKIDALSGDVKVKVGENVHKGDLLVSGIVESMSGTAFVKSKAVVTAQVEEKYCEKDVFRRSIKLKTGKQGCDTVLEILGIRVPVFLPRKTENADVSYRIYRAQFIGKKLPVTVYRRKYEYYRNMTVSADEETLRERLFHKLNKFLNDSDIAGYIPIGTEYFTDSKEIIISHRYLCDTNIGTETAILLSQ